MKVLHIWDACGVSCLLAKSQREMFGWDSKTVSRAVYDVYDTVSYYGETNYPYSSFIFKQLALAHSLRSDLVHLHALDHITRRISAFKPVVLHYHGSDVRGRWGESRRRWKWAEKIIVSTLDLLDGAPDNVSYLPNPVDVDLFKPRANKPVSGMAIHFVKSVRDEKWASDVAKTLDLELVLQKRVFKYRDVPSVLTQYEFLIDRNEIPSLSKIALEALSVGLKVVRWDGYTVKDLPAEHKPDNVARRLKQIIED